MKLMIASDIHGSAVFCRQLLEAFDREHPWRLLLLGDILYHGPRNDLPEGYAPKEVIAMLNPLAPSLLCVRGNCDTEVDQMVLSFPILSDSCLVSLDGATLFATHGHHFGPEQLPPLAAGDILVSGHTHVPLCQRVENVLCLNPGSVSIPKENSPRGYLVWEDGNLQWKTLEGTVWKSLSAEERAAIMK